VAFVELLNLGWRKKVTKRYTVEKRNEPRTKTSNLLKFKPQGEGSQERVSNLIDLSESGLQFYNRESMELDTVLHLVINIPEKKIEIPAVVKVIWARPAKHGRLGYCIGVSFLEIGERDKNLVREFVLEERARRGTLVFAPSMESV
jgi:hypothetical protein